MENQDNHYYQRKYVNEMIRVNTIILNKQAERQRRLRSEVDLMRARIDYLIDMAGQLREEEE